MNSIWTALPDCAPLTSALFQLGRILATPAALRAMQEAGAGPCDYLRRHLTGSWGIVSNTGHHANDPAVREFGHPFVASLEGRHQGLDYYRGDRSETTILLPAE